MSIKTAESGNGTMITVSLRDVFEFIWRGAPLALSIALVAAALAFLVSRNVEPMYRATATLLASQPAASYGNLGIITPPQIDPDIYRSAVLDGPILRQVLSSTTDEPITTRNLQDLREKIRVITESQLISSLIRIEVSDRSPEVAAEYANLLAEALLAWDRDRARQNFASSVRALEQAVAAVEQEIAALGNVASDEGRSAALLELRDRRQRELNAARALSNSAVVIGLLESFKLATPPDEPFNSRVALATALALALGLIGSYVVMLLRASLDTRIRGSDELTNITGLPVMAEFARPAKSGYQLSHEATSFLRTNLLLATGDVQPKVFLITTAQNTREKTGVAVNLAESFARSKNRTLLIDADLRHPSSTQIFNLNPIEFTPLEVYLENPHQRYLPISVRAEGKRSFDLIPSFSAARSPVDLLNQGFREHLEVWRTQYDVIIIDSTPVLPFADTLAIAPYCTGVILSVSLKDSSAQQIHTAVELLRRIGVRILGTVVTNLRRSQLADQHFGYGVNPSEPPPITDPYKTQTFSSIPQTSTSQTASSNAHKSR